MNQLDAGPYEGNDGIDPNWAHNPRVAETDYAIMRKLNNDNVELRAEIEQLRRAWRDESEKYVAEIERLQQKVSDAQAAASGFRMQRDQAEAEIEKLRAIVDAARQCPVCRVAHKDLFAALDESPQ